MRVLIQLRTTRQLRAAFAAEEHVPPSATAAEALTPLGLVVDEGFDPVSLPAPRLGAEDRSLLALGGPLEFSTRPEDTTQLVRGTIPEDEAQQAVLAEAMAHPGVVGIYADPVIEHCLTCGSDRLFQNLLRVVLHLSRRRIMLRYLPVASSENPSVVRDDERRRAGGSLIESENAAALTHRAVRFAAPGNARRETR